MAKIKNLKYLVLCIRRAKSEIHNEKWVRTARPNMFFIDIEKEQIVFTIYNADLFIGIVDDQVYFLRQRKIVMMTWGTRATEVEEAVKAVPLKKQKTTFDGKVKPKVGKVLRFEQPCTKVYKCSCH